MTHVRISKWIFRFFIGAGVLFAAFTVLVAVESSVREAWGMGLFVLACIVVLCALRNCELEYDDEVVRCRRLIGWREIRIDEIDRAKRGQWATIYCAGKRRFRYDYWANDEGDLEGLIERSRRRQGRDLVFVEGGFYGFVEWLYAGKLAIPGEYFIGQMLMLAMGPLFLAFMAVEDWRLLLNPLVLRIFGAVELIMIAFCGIMLYIVRHADQHPRLARMVARDWAWREQPPGRKRR